MSADLPAPADAQQLQYADVNAQLFFDTGATQQEIADFYRKAMGKSGWKATTDSPIKIDFKHEMIFRNPGNGHAHAGNDRSGGQNPRAA